MSAKDFELMEVRVQVITTAIALELSERQRVVQKVNSPAVISAFMALTDSLRVLRDNLVLRP